MDIVYYNKPWEHFEVRSFCRVSFLKILIKNMDFRPPGDNSQAVYRAAVQKQRLAPRLRAAPLFAFCLLRRGLSGHSSYVPPSFPCLLHLSGLCAKINFRTKLDCKDVVSATLRHHWAANLSNSGFHKSYVRKELTATSRVRVWSWHDIATKLQIVILL